MSNPSYLTSLGEGASERGDQAAGWFSKILFILVLFLSLLGMTQVLFLAFPMPFWSIVAFGIYGLFVCVMALFLPVSFLLLLPYIFFRATTLASGVAIEYGGYIVDFAQAGEATGACIRLSMVYVIFVCFGAMIIEWLYNRFKPNADQLSFITKRTQRHPWVWVVFGIFVLFSLYMLALGVRVGFPILSGVDRFVFREEIGGRAYIFYMSNRPLMAFLFGVIIYFCGGLRRYLAVFFFMGLIGISILFGEKFTSLIILSIYVITPAYLTSRYLQGRILQQVLPVLLVVACLTIPVVLMVYGWSDNQTEALERLTGRMVGQGEIWYVADRDTYSAFRFDGDKLSHIASSLISQNPRGFSNMPPYIGTGYFMFNYMPPDIVSIFLERPSLSLTFAFEGYLLVTFGWLGMIVPLCFFAGVYAVALAYLAWSLINARPISIFLAGKILVWIVSGLTQGNPHMIIGVKTLSFACLIVIYELVSGVLADQQKASKRNIKSGG